MADPFSKATKHTDGTSDSWHGKLTPEGPFKPENDRYHLYIGLFCPFAHRVNILRHLKGLESILPITVVKPYPKGQAGWAFPATDTEYPGATPDPHFEAQYLHEVYFDSDAGYKGKYSVPVLWDKQTQMIVNNESFELLRDLQTAFNDVLPEDDPRRNLTLYPEALRAKIDEISPWMQRDLNSGVYKAGFAETQEVYDEKVLPVFASLNRIEKIISENGGPYVLGKTLTELDVLLYATIIRFDAAYVQHFKCDLGTIRHDYPQINNWLKNMYWNEDAFRNTTDFKHIKENYTKSHHKINPLSITPRGPWPVVEDGYEPDLSKVRVGGVLLPEVVELEKKLP